MNRDEMLADLTPFSDLGAGLPKIAEKDGSLQVKMIRDNKQIKISLSLENGKVQASFGGNPARHFASFQNLLAAEGFANLRRWADSQRDYLRSDSVAPSDLIPFHAKSHDGAQLDTVDSVDLMLGKPRVSQDSAEVILIDGPAGIGKTTLIEQLALLRAENYRTSTRPLFLHVKSRGRILSNLQDLMAFSLQTLRLAITYDQIPILVKHGLVVLAIDGFDELGDPSGYELAWAQVNDLVTSIRGNGTVVLAGRDTFIGRERLIRDVKALRKGVDTITEIVMDVPGVSQAKTWLKKSGQWTDASFALASVAVLLEPNSYALRPVFLRLLREQIKPKEIKTKSEGDLTALLVNHMVDREASKFGTAVESALGQAKLREFIVGFLKEVARDMADSQSESLDSTALVWIAETALGSGQISQVESLIKNRVGVLAFLADDERPGHKKFSHIQIMNFFLATVTLEAISSGDVPKYVRRNVLGRDFLLGFGDVALASSGAGEPRVTDFVREALKFSRSYAQNDRGIKNIGALLLSTLPSLRADERILINGYQVDEGIIRGTAAPCRVENVAISQLDVRGADLSAVAFESVSIVTLIADEGTRFSTTFPNVSLLMNSIGQQQISVPEDIAAWIDARGRAESNQGTVQEGIQKQRQHPVLRLLGRACRLRQYWLRSEGDEHAARILKDPWWDALSGVLNEFGFLRKEVDRQASGRSSTFFHIRQTEKLLAVDRDDGEVMKVYQALLGLINSPRQ